MDKRKPGSLTLRLAGAYNMLWGASVIFFPFLFFDLSGLPRPFYPEIWQCVGMIVGVCGLGYWLAAENPVEHWIIVLVGMLGKIFGPIGFLKAIYDGVFNTKMAIVIVFNDIIWWIPFGLILMEVYRRKQDGKAKS